MRIFFAAVFVLFGLSGCGCIDCTNTKSEYSDAIQRIAILEKDNGLLSSQAAFFEEKEVRQRAAERAVLIARVCDYVLPVCTNDVTRPGRELIEKFGVEFDTMSFFKWQIFKILAFAVIAIAWALLITLGWLLVIAPQKADVDNAREAVEASDQLLNDAREQSEALVSKAQENAARAVQDGSKRQMAAEKKLGNALEEFKRVDLHLAEKKQELRKLDAQIADLRKNAGLIKELGSF